jgi:hypothetical protein
MAPLPTKRSALLPYGSRVACWPSTGGIWIKHAPPIEMDFLNLSAANDTERPLEKTYYYTTTCPITDPEVYAPPPLTEEDLFCQKMRMIGADFWDQSQIGIELNGNPIEHVIKPKYYNHLGVYWDVFSDDEPYIVNLTEARQKYDPGLKGYNTVKSFDDRLSVVEELGGFRCALNFEKCFWMWCSQYHEHCHEKDRIQNLGLVRDEWFTFYNWRGGVFQQITRRKF